MTGIESVFVIYGLRYTLYFKIKIRALLENVTSNGRWRGGKGSRKEERF